MRRDELERAGLRVLAHSREAGAGIVESPCGARIFSTGHLEYDPDTLDKEYRRDKDRGLEPSIPVNYYPGGDPAQPPLVRWRAHAHLFFSNWLNYYVYQETPYQIQAIRKEGRHAPTF